MLPLESSLEVGRRVIETEARRAAQSSSSIGRNVFAPVDLLQGCQGSVIVSGMGKAGLIGQKLAATFASTGTRSHFLHPAEAIHGDLGRVHCDDVILMLSHSGETEEVLRLLPSLIAFGVPLVAMTGRPHSQLELAGQPSCSGSVRSRKPAAWGWPPAPAPR